MDKCNISVIMPVYNDEDYLSDTLQSIMKQTYQDFEVIVVDDGSTDHTKEIIKDYKEKDSRIQYHYQQQTNAGVARNYGMSFAQGKYVMFLDGDDLFDENLLGEMYAQIEKESADICLCNADQYDTSSKQFISKPQYLRKEYLPAKGTFSREDIGSAIFYFTSLVPWNKLIKREFLENYNIQFQDIKRANDQFFSCMSLVFAKRITIVDKVLVHYRVGQGDNLTTHFSDTPLCAFEAMLAVRKALEKADLWKNQDIRRAFDNKAINLSLFSLNIQRTIEGYKKLYTTLKEYGFEELGIVLREEDYYFNPLEYQNFKYILENSFEEYLLLKNREYRDTISRKNSLIKQKNDILKDLQREKKELQKKEKELNYIKNTKRYRLMAKLTGFYHMLFDKGQKKFGKRQKE